jgi:mRNA interferase HigB
MAAKDDTGRGDTGRARKNHVISRRKIEEFLDAHPEHARVGAALRSWYKTAVEAQWTNFGKVRETYGSADAVGKLVVFNIAGNKVRLVTEIRYSLKPRRIYIRYVLTHAEYDQGDWKEED